MLTMTERATIFFSHHNDGKKPEEVGLKTAIPFSYKTMGDKVKGVIFAQAKNMLKLLSQIKKPYGLW